MGFSLAAGLLAWFSLGGIARHWRQSSSTQVGLWVGWLGVLLSWPLWLQGNGAEFGTLYWFFSITFSGLFWVFALRTHSIEKRQTIHRPLKIGFPLPRWGMLRDLQKMLWATLLAGVAGILMAAFLCTLFPWPNSSVMAAACYLFPLCWGVLAYLLLASQRPWRHGGYVALWGGLCAAGLWGIA